jgi:hypothetical protein
MKTYAHFWTYLNQFLFEMKRVLDKSYTENKTKYFALDISFWKFCRLRGKMEKLCRAEQATDDNMAHAHCVLDT